jgi:prevent-host-death family protein
MGTVNIHEAKTHLSKLIEKAVAGEEIVIAKAGKPLVRLIALEPAAPKSRIGFMEGQFKVPEDFDTMFQDEIEKMFYGTSDEYAE